MAGELQSAGFKKIYTQGNLDLDDLLALIIEYAGNAGFNVAATYMIEDAAPFGTDLYVTEITPKFFKLFVDDTPKYALFSYKTDNVTESIALMAYRGESITYALAHPEIDLYANNCYLINGQTFIYDYYANNADVTVSCSFDGYLSTAWILVELSTESYSPNNFLFATTTQRHISDTTLNYAKYGIFDLAASSPSFDFPFTKTSRWDSDNEEWYENLQADSSNLWSPITDNLRSESTEANLIVPLFTTGVTYDKNTIHTQLENIFKVAGNFTHNTIYYNTWLYYKIMHDAHYMYGAYFLPINANGLTTET
jgi:hypothetical protein